jgi:hypothetical protein
LGHPRYQPTLTKRLSVKSVRKNFKGIWKSNVEGAIEEDDERNDFQHDPESLG